MSAILALLGGKVGAFALGALIPVVLIILKKVIPSRIGSLVAGLFASQAANIDKIDDPKRKELIKQIVLDLVKLAEYELPEKGQGKARYDKVAARLCAIIPVFKGQEAKISEIIENAVIAADAELKKQIPN